MNTAVMKVKLVATLGVAFVLLQPVLAQAAYADAAGGLRAAPQWNDHRSFNRNDTRSISRSENSGVNRGSNNSGFTFNSSLGYIPISTIDTLNSPRSNGQGQVIIIQPGNRPTGYERDRSGNCIETTADRFGTTFRRKTGRHNCNF
jgi:hypothetical protein